MFPRTWACREPWWGGGEGFGGWVGVRLGWLGLGLGWGWVGVGLGWVGLGWVGVKVSVVGGLLAWVGLAWLGSGAAQGFWLNWGFNFLAHPWLNYWPSRAALELILRGIEAGGLGPQLWSCEHLGRSGLEAGGKHLEYGLGLGCHVPETISL